MTASINAVVTGLRRLSSKAHETHIGCHPPLRATGLRYAGHRRRAPAPSSSPAGTRYEFNGMVLESPEHGPELCSMVMLSMPPQGGGVPLVGWDWGIVGGEERLGGTIWGKYRVVGTYDGKTFSLAERPGPVRPEQLDTKIGSACVEPSGGWQRPYPERTTDQDLQVVSAYERPRADFAGLWISGDTPVSANGVQDISRAVLNLGFTGGLDRHEADVRKHWGGALCLVKCDRTLAELERIALDAHSFAHSQGLRVTYSGADEAHWVVEIGVFFADAAVQKKMGERFPGVTVKLIGKIRPVE